MIDAWSNADFIISQEIPVKISLLDSVFFETATTVIFLVCFLWLVSQTKWCQNLIKRTSLRGIPYSFPPSGFIAYDPHEPQVGYATIAVKNQGHYLSNCIGTVIGVSMIDARDFLKVTPMSIETGQLCWEYGNDGCGISIPLPNDGVTRRLNVGYLDQNVPGEWQLALADQSRRQKLGVGWYKVDVVVSSESERANPLRIALAIGLGIRQPPAISSGLLLGAIYR